MTSNGAKMFEFTGTHSEILERYSALGWTDGLPIVPPTQELVEGMIAGANRVPSEVIAVFPTNGADATVESVAVNAVMAGCVPDYFPVVLAAVEAMGDPALNLRSLAATTNPTAVMLVCSGEIAKTLGINSKGGCLGPGFRANATIGRAAMLALRNIGGAIPQVLDMATHGQPGKLTMCIAENEEESPWHPFRVDMGFSLDSSTVTAISVVGTQNILDAGSNNATSLLGTLAQSCANPGAQNVQLGGGPLLILGPEHAAVLSADGYTKDDVKRFLYENARVPANRFSPEVLAYWVQHRRPRWLHANHAMATFPIGDSPELIRIVVAGGPGAHSVYCPSLGEMTAPATRDVGLFKGSSASASAGNSQMRRPVGHPLP
jgi:hypothetical protein